MPVSPQHLAGLVDLVTGMVINENSAKVVLKEMFQTGQAASLNRGGQEPGAGFG